MQHTVRYLLQTHSLLCFLPRTAVHDRWHIKPTSLSAGVSNGEQPSTTQKRRSTCCKVDRCERLKMLGACTSVCSLCNHKAANNVEKVWIGWNAQQPTACRTRLYFYIITAIHSQQHDFWHIEKKLCCKYPQANSFFYPLEKQKSATLSEGP